MGFDSHHPLQSQPRLARDGQHGPPSLGHRDAPTIACVGCRFHTDSRHRYVVAPGPWLAKGTAMSTDGQDRTVVIYSPFRLSLQHNERRHVQSTGGMTMRWSESRPVETHGSSTRGDSVGFPASGRTITCNILRRIRRGTAGLEGVRFPSNPRSYRRGRRRSRESPHNLSYRMNTWE